jgi:hypothetical protein
VTACSGNKHACPVVVRGSGAVCLLLTVFADPAGASAGISKTRADALRQFEIPMAPAPAGSFGETLNATSKPPRRPLPDSRQNRNSTRKISSKPQANQKVQLITPTPN